MKNKINAHKALKAIKVLKDGIDSNDKAEIIRAYDFIEKDATFNWDGLDDLFKTWDTLVSDANDILNEE